MAPTWDRRRRAALESLFAARRLTSPWTSCPSTTDTDTVREWLTWTAVGMEGIVFKRLDDAYHPAARGWHKYKSSVPQVAVSGAVPVPVLVLRPGWAAEPKWDGFRALVAVDVGPLSFQESEVVGGAPAPLDQKDGGVIAGVPA
ncbi:hypothetical protein ACFWWT_47935 [Streptomyces sp. NPDC058676]|uniref:ATP-dependent DNA ligase n=1 Tax=unclassified Streptomyces TaxID=2593676 RepID=UPI0036681891